MIMGALCMYKHKCVYDSMWAFQYKQESKMGDVGALLCPTIVVYGCCSLMNFSHPKLLGKESGLLEHISQTQAAILLSSVTWQIPWHSPAGGTQLDLKRFCYMVCQSEQTQFPAQNVCSFIYKSILLGGRWIVKDENSPAVFKYKHTPKRTQWDTMVSRGVSHSTSFYRLTVVSCDTWWSITLYSLNQTYTAIEYLKRIIHTKMKNLWPFTVFILMLFQTKVIIVNLNK